MKSLVMFLAAILLSVAAPAVAQTQNAAQTIKVSVGSLDTLTLTVSDREVVTCDTGENLVLKKSGDVVCGTDSHDGAMVFSIDEKTLSLVDGNWQYICPVHEPLVRNDNNEWKCQPYKQKVTAG